MVKANALVRRSAPCALTSCTCPLSTGCTSGNFRPSIGTRATRRVWSSVSMTPSPSRTRPETDTSGHWCTYRLVGSIDRISAVAASVCSTSRWVAMIVRGCGLALVRTVPRRYRPSTLTALGDLHSERSLPARQRRFQRASRTFSRPWDLRPLLPSTLASPGPSGACERPPRWCTQSPSWRPMHASQRRGFSTSSRTSWACRHDA